MCTFCDEKLEKPLHLIWECIDSQKIWKALVRWLKYFCSIEVKLSSEIVILNNSKRYQKQLINIIVLIVKQYLYAQRYFKKKPNFQQLICKIIYCKKIEEYIAKRNGRLKKHKAKWQAFNM